MRVRLSPFGLVLAVLLVFAVAGLGRAQAPEPAVGDFGGLKASLDWVEQAAKKEARTDEAYAEARRALAPLRDELRARIDALEPQLADTDNRLKQLGEAPAAGAAPEDGAVAAERAKLTRERADLDGALKQARLLLTRADQIADQINERRRAIFASELFARSPGLFDPAFWRDAASGVAADLDTLGQLLGTWRDYARDRGGIAGVAGAALLLTALAGIGIAVWRWWRRRLREQAVETRFGRALVAMLVLLGHAVAGPVAALAVVQILDATGLAPSEVRGLGIGFTVAFAIAAFGRGAALALFAPGEGARRLIACEDNEATTLASYLTLAARVLALAVFLNILHKALAAPLALTVATSVLFAVAVGAIALHLLLRSPVGRTGATSEVGTAVPGLRALCWLVVIVVAGALVSRHAGFAAFVAGRFVVLLAIAAALAVVLTFVDVVLTETLAGDTPRGRAVAALFGISPRTLELMATLMSAAVRLLLLLIAVVPVLGPWGVFAADIFGALKDIAFGFRVGEVTISLAAIATALACLVAGVLVARYAQRWLTTRVMPRTGLDTGLQHSIATLAGYVLLIVVLSLTLAALGIDLQKVALIAGALSVGIGFGLQSIVSNFVSGLILLAERPIRVGDWVVVKGEEGFVRRISVRATEIETFDRASVIIPNSEFITGVVKNWTHSNTLGRITVKVRASYDSDVDKVRDILLSIGAAHPQVLQNPPPRVFLAGFGDIGLDFELRCILLNVETGLTVKSELHAEILKAFRDAGIAMAYPPHEVRVPGLRVGD